MSAIKHRQTYPELSRLSKARGLRSIRFKRTTPGVAARLLLAPSSTPLVDSSHPLAAVSPHQLRRLVPQYSCSLFQAHAYPHAVLSRFENPSFFKQMKGKGISDELDDALDAQTANLRRKKNDSTGNTRDIMSSGDRRRAMHTIPMSLVIVTPKKSVHRFAVVRVKVKLRLREALRLVAIRGARLKHSEGKLAESNEIALDSPDGITKDAIQRTPILQGWTYIIRPNLEIYRCPWPSLLDHVAKALVRMQSQGDALERKWGVGNHDQRSAQAKRGFDGETKRHLSASILQPPRTTPPARQQPQESRHKSAAFRSMPSYASHSAQRSEQIPRTRSQNTERGSDNAAKPSTFSRDSVPNRNPKSSDIQATHQRQSFPRESAGVFRSTNSYMRRPAGESEHYPHKPLHDTGDRTYRSTKLTHEERPREGPSFRSTPPHSRSSAGLDQPPVGPRRHTENDSSARTTRPSHDSGHDSPARRSPWNSPRGSYSEPPKSPPEVPAKDGRSTKPGRLFQSPIVIVKPQGSQGGRRGPSSQGDGRSGGPNR